MVGKDKTRLRITVKKTSKAKLEQQAKKEKIPLSKYCTKILEEKAGE